MGCEKKRENWDIYKIPWYVRPKTTFFRLVLSAQVIFLLIGIFSGISFPGDGLLKSTTAYIAGLSCRRMISVAGLAAVADSFSLAGVFFVWVVNSAPEQHCTVPMPTLYKWVYPHFRENFLFSMALLLFCVYEGSAQSANLSRGIYFFIGGSIGSIYILNMCWAFTFDTAKSRDIAHSYIITKINDPDEQDRGLTGVWKQRLLKDCYTCLERQYYKNLEVILNASLVWDHQKIPSIFFNSALRDETAEPAEVEMRLLFLRSQLTAWNDILSGHGPIEQANLLILDVKRLRQELRGEFLPQFKLSSHAKVFNQEDYGKTDLRSGRAAWFLAFLRYSDYNVALFAQIYNHARNALSGPGNFSYTVDRTFHQLLLVARFYYVIDQEIGGGAAGIKPDCLRYLSSMWDQLSNPLRLTNDDFDYLFTLSALLYAADNMWTLDHYILKLFKLRDIGFSEKSVLQSRDFSYLPTLEDS